MACSNESATDGEKDLRNMGFADSKTLNLEARDKFRLQIEATEWIDYKVDVIMPQKLSAKMLRKHKYNLNLISHDSAIHLVQSTINEGFDIREVTFENYIDTIAITRIVYVDTVGDPSKYQAKLTEHFPGAKLGIKIVVAKKADSLYPIVSAASICAKTTRDRVLEDWSFPEEQGRESFSRNFGSGYPADPNTKKWLNAHCDSVFGFPDIVRFSWSTTRALLEKHAVEVQWPEDLEEEREKMAYFIKESRLQPRRRLFRRSKLELVTSHFS